MSACTVFSIRSIAAASVLECYFVNSTYVEAQRSRCVLRSLLPQLPVGSTSLQVPIYPLFPPLNTPFPSPPSNTLAPPGAALHRHARLPRVVRTRAPAPHRATDHRMQGTRRWVVVVLLMLLSYLYEARFVFHWVRSHEWLRQLNPDSISSSRVALCFPLG